MESVDFSIITPVYNGEKFLRETIDSVLSAMDGHSAEYIIIDDGSTDFTSEVISEYREKLIYVLKENGGQASAVNVGLAMARGRYSVIVNSDDPLPTGILLTESKKILEAKGEVVVTYPNWNEIDEWGNVLNVRTVPEYSLSEMIGNFNCIVGPGGVFRTELGKKVGGWDVSFRFVPDYNFWLKLTEFGDFQKIPLVLASWRNHGNSISQDGRGYEMGKENVRVVTEFLEQRKVSRKLRRLSLSNAYYHAAVLVWFDSSVPGRSWFLKALTFRPSLIIRKKPWAVAFILASPIGNILLEKFRLLKVFISKI